VSTCLAYWRVSTCLAHWCTLSRLSALGETASSPIGAEVKGEARYQIDLKKFKYTFSDATDPSTRHSATSDCD